MSTAYPTTERFGISLSLSQPQFAVSGSNPTTVVSSVPGNPLAIFDAFDSLSWVNTANGGFETCSWTIGGTMQDVERWLQEGLGAHVEARDEAGVIRWEGRVNLIRVTAGGLRWQWGPLTDIGNRVGMRYNVINTATTPPTESEQTFYGWEEYADSQRRYGVSVVILSGGGMTFSNAGIATQTWMYLNAFPKLSTDVALGGEAGTISIQFQALGYKAWLGYPYNNTPQTGLVGADAKVGAILDADPNGFFSSANAEIRSTLFLNEVANESIDRSAWDLITSYTRCLDSGIYRSMARVGPGRFFQFTPAPGYSNPRDPDYMISLGDPGHYQVRDLNGALVRPWAVDAGTFAMLTDVMPGREFVNTIYPIWWEQDPRLMFVERVTFTAPDRLQLVSGAFSDIPAMLKKFGIGSIN